MEAEAHREATDELSEIIVNNARRIQDRVKELADAVKGATTAPEFHPCRIAGCAADVMTSLRRYAADKGVVLQAEGLDALPVIHADERRLFNALYNLVDNAIPEVPAGGSVTVRGSVEADKEVLVLTVADTGKGMPPDVRERLFTSGVRSNKSGGTRLGTKIVKDVVAAHKGAISVESAVGVGTTITIRLPLTHERL